MRRARALGLVHPPAVEALKGLGKAAKDKSATVRLSAVDSLGDMGRAAAPAVPALIEALADEDASVRGKAAWSLARVGPAGKDALPALKQLAEKDTVSWVRGAAARAIKKIQIGQAGP